MPEVIQQFDEQALVWMAQNLRSGLLNPIVTLYTHLGDAGLLFIALGLVMLLFKSTRRAGFSALCAMVIGLVVVNLTIKPQVARPRPWDVITDTGFTSLAFEEDFSFPSGHTNAAFAFAIALCMAAPKRWMKITAVCVAAVMGLSRLYVGVHFPSDVLAGALIGSLCGLAGALIVKIIWERLEPRIRKAQEPPPDAV